MPEQRKPDFPHGRSVRLLASIVRLKFRQSNGLLGPAYRLLIQMAEIQAEIHQLNAKVKRLTPKNSSAPPSMQHPHARPTAKPKSKTKNPRGGQNGNKRTIREQIPVEECREVIPLHSTECRRCREGLKGEGAEPLRHQVWELPKIEPIITEYQQTPPDLLNMPRCPATALPKPVGESFREIINCNRPKMYWGAKRLQGCWAHLFRDIRALVDHENHEAKWLGFDLKRQVGIMFSI